jgi:hypothetical protein
MLVVAAVFGSATVSEAGGSSGLDVKVKADAKVGGLLDVNAKVKADLDAKVKVKADVKVGGLLDLDAKVKADVKLNGLLDLKAKVKADVDVDADLDATLKVGAKVKLRYCGLLPVVLKVKARVGGLVLFHGLVVPGQEILVDAKLKADLEIHLGGLLRGLLRIGIGGGSCGPVTCEPPRSCEPQPPPCEPPPPPPCEPTPPTCGGGCS